MERRNPSQTAKSLFLDAVERSAAERAAFLEAACGDDATLRAAVEELLAAHAAADSGSGTRAGAPTHGVRGPDRPVCAFGAHPGRRSPIEAPRG